MKSRREFFTFSIFWILVLIVLQIFENSVVDIKKVLKTDSYSYLPVEAKNYVEKIYEESGEVILTEKNKRDNSPYLNPRFIEYLSLSKEEQDLVAEVPEVYQIDFIPNEKVDGDTPSKFDLRNVNGNNYVTPIRDQGNLDLCWSFTSLEQTESYLLQKAGTSYNANSSIFSTRQLDYATSYDGIKDYQNEFGARGLTNGGNFFMASVALTNGISYVNESDIPFSESENQLSLANVMSYAKSKYEATQTIRIPSLTSYDSQTVASYVNVVKEYVQENGGAYVGTQAPNYSCASNGDDNIPVIRVDTHCKQDGNHAMQIIGWDDTYAYKYCVVPDTTYGGEKHMPWTSSCSSSNTVSGTGVWILRNSWGEDWPYAYLAYDAMDYDVSLTTQVVSMNDKNWDNNYHQNLDNYYIIASKTGSQFFNKKINTPEKVQKVKFFVYGSNGSFRVTITSRNHTYSDVKTITTTLPGFYTIDLSDKNIVIDEEGFNVEIRGSTEFVRGSISAFTKNTTTNSIIQTDPFYEATASNGNYSHIVYSNTKNIPSGTEINYALTDINGNNFSNYLSATDKMVARNEVNAKVSISSSITPGVYMLHTSYGTYRSASLVAIGITSGITGTGTQSDPYLVHNENELKLLSYMPNSHYKLASDITLTEPWTPIGSENVPFTGSFDGDGHTIYGLEIPEGFKYNGLFGYVEASAGETTSFKNITIDHPQIDASGIAGGLIGYLTGASGVNSNRPVVKATIQDVFIQGGHVNSYFEHAGAIVGKIQAPFNEHVGTHTYNFNRIFSSSSVGGVLSSGMIGFIEGHSNNSYAPTININNVQNAGVIDLTNVVGNRSVYYYSDTHATMIGYSLFNVKMNVKFYVDTTYFKDTSYNNSGTNKVISGTIGSGGSFTKSNGFSYLAGSTLSQMRDSSNYNGWTNFGSNWIIHTIDSVPRIPVLVGSNFQYTSIADIEIQPGEIVYLSDYVSPRMDAAYKLTAGTPSNTGVIQTTAIKDNESDLNYDVKIEGLAYGTSTIHVTNAYDGYEKDITITVKYKRTADIIYYANDGTDFYTSETVDYASNHPLKGDVFARTGYKFGGWNTKADGSGTSYTSSQPVEVNFDSLTLYAKWQPITYTIKFNSNGGTGSMSPLDADYNENVTLTKNTFIREGYRFTGWNTQANGNGISYDDEHVVKNLSSTDGAEINLYAQWQRDGTGFEIEDYVIDDQKNYLDQIAPETTLQSYKDHFLLGTGYTMSIDLGDKQYIYTGSIVHIYYNGSEVFQYTNIVNGDASGDGVINSGDLLKIVKHLKGTLMNDAQITASDCNYDHTINSGDLLKIVKYLKGSATILR